MNTNDAGSRLDSALSEGLGPTPHMTVGEFFAEAKRKKLRVLGTPEETRAALDLKDAEISKLRGALQRLTNGQHLMRVAGKRCTLRFDFECCGDDLQQAFMAAIGA